MKQQHTSTKPKEPDNEALRLIAWFDEEEGFRQGTKAHHKWVLQAESELRRLHSTNTDLLTALHEIAEWTERYTTPGHPISTVARAAIVKATGGEG